MKKYRTTDNRTWIIPDLAPPQKLALDLVAEWAKSTRELQTEDAWHGAIFWLAASQVSRTMSGRDPNVYVSYTSSPSSEEILSAVVWDLFKWVESVSSGSVPQEPSWE